MTTRREPTPGQPITSVDAGSLAAEAGLRHGDRVVAVNGVAPRDAIDFRFRTTEDFVALDVIHDGAPGVVEFEKPTDETLGIEFAGEAFGGTSLCNNKCFFCFLKGTAQGPAAAAVHQGRRLPPLVSARQLCHAHQSLDDDDWHAP